MGVGAKVRRVWGEGEELRRAMLSAWRMPALSQSLMLCVCVCVCGGGGGGGGGKRVGEEGRRLLLSHQLTV